LRESPMVDLTEALVGWGIDIKIYDPNVTLARLRGRNLSYIDLHLPHLAQLLSTDLESVLAHAELLVLTNDVANDLNLTGKFHGKIIDLRFELAKPAV